MRLLVSLIVTLALVSTASAANYVWFEATSGVPVTQGAAGVTLVLPAGGTYGIDVKMSLTGVFYGFDVALQGPVAGASGANLTSVYLPAGWIGASSVGTNPIFHNGAYGSTSITGGPTLVGHFDLTIGDNGSLIGGSWDDGGGWGDDQGMFPEVWFGGYATADSGPGGWASGPAIRSLPEPATLALLGLGLVGLLRRR